jgi:hypothetical protein
MRTLATPLHVARHLLETDRAWLMFVEIPARAVEGGFYRLVNNTQNIVAPIEGGVDGDGDPIRGFVATSMQIVLPEEDGQGTLGRLEITIPNVSRIPMAVVETDLEGGPVDEGDILGQVATVWLANERDVTTVYNVKYPFTLRRMLSWRHRVKSATMNEKVAKFACGHRGGQRSSPGPRFDRSRFPQLLASASQGVVRVSA